VPRLSRWFVRSALAYLMAGFTAGAFILFQKGGAGMPGAWRFHAAHIAWLTIGWSAQLAMGVAFWILPRWFRSPRPRGDVRPAWASWALMNVGLPAAGLGPALRLPDAVALSGQVAVALAGVAFLLHAWPRLKALAGGVEPGGVGDP